MATSAAPEQEAAGSADPSAPGMSLALLGLAQAVDAVYGDVARGLGLTPPQARLLCRCLSNPSVGELAGQLHCDPSNVTRHAERLATRELLVRRNDEHDGRIARLSLTRTGQDLVEQIRNHATAELTRRLDAAAPPLPGETAHVLRELTERLTREATAPGQR